jgi:peroxiredoxin/predicted 2-oxoglutarate/Fe(II)-dependent dioxygenase YbiX
MTSQEGLDTRMVFPGDPAPRFVAKSTVSDHLRFDSLAGRYIVLSFLGSGAHPAIAAILEGLERHRTRFAQIDTVFFGVSVDPDDQRLGRMARHDPGIEFIWDFDRSISRLYGVAPAAAASESAFRPQTLILDRGMRIVALIPVDPGGAERHIDQVVAALDHLPPLFSLGGFPPILQVPYVFEPDFCRRLIAEFERNGGQNIGILRQIDGQTVRVREDAIKRRSDYDLIDPELLGQVHERLRRRLVPAIKEAFQFNATHVERNLIGCYDAANAGGFLPHRDDSTIGSSHRRFAVTINLNAEEYSGGDLRFREFGLQTYRAPTGAAIVFSCSLLHEVLPVEKGKRYAFLPFIHDEEAARIWEVNRQNLQGGTAAAV